MSGKMTMFLVILLFSACAKESDLVDSPGHLLRLSPVQICEGILHLDSQKTFDSLVRIFANKDTQYLNNWENRYGVRSLRNIYEKAIEEEDTFLEEIVNRKGDDQSLTREKIGYSAYTRKYLAKGSLILDEDGLIDMNVTVPSFSSLLNEDRIVKIGGELYQFNKNEVKVIRDERFAKIKYLVNSTCSNEEKMLEIIPVIRSTRELLNNAGRTLSFGANCSDAIGNFKVIGYEEDVHYGSGNCLDHWDFWVKIRSLRKILGTWQNYKTNFMSVTGDIKIVHWAVDNSGKQLPYVYRVIVDESGVNHPLDFDHTGKYFFVNHYPEACYVYDQGYSTQFKFYRRQYTVYGYNNTSCGLGESPFYFCQVMTNSCP